MGNLLEPAPESAQDEPKYANDSTDERPATPPVPTSGDKSALEASLELSKCEDENEDIKSEMKAVVEQKVEVHKEPEDPALEIEHQETEAQNQEGEFSPKEPSPRAEKENKATDPMPVDAVAQTSITNSASIDPDSSFEQLKTDRALEANSSSFSTSSLDTSNPGTTYKILQG